MIHISLASEPLFHIGPLVLTNSILTAIIGSVIIFLLFYTAARQVSLHPKSRLSLLIEGLSDALIGLIEQLTGNRRQAVLYFPLLITFFVFIVVNNWLGLLPGVGSIFLTTSEGQVPLFRAANADLNMTIALAIISVIMTHIYAFRELGVASHMKKYFNVNPILSFVGLLEIISEFSKMISFSFRLFGNIFAGEVLLVVIAYLVPLIGPLPFFALELFVGLIQGLVFTLLTLVFLVTATAKHGHGESDHETNGNRSPAASSVEAALP